MQPYAARASSCSLTREVLAAANAIADRVLPDGGEVAKSHDEIGAIAAPSSLPPSATWIRFPSDSPVAEKLSIEACFRDFKYGTDKPGKFYTASLKSDPIVGVFVKVVEKSEADLHQCCQSEGIQEHCQGQGVLKIIDRFELDCTYHPAHWGKVAICTRFCRDAEDAFSEEGATAQRVLQFVFDGARGLQNIHARGVVHCDIKLENFVCDGRNFYITDFGCAFPLEGPSGDHHTRDKFNCGTIDYHAPEITKGTGSFTPASDMWAFGKTIDDAVREYGLSMNDEVDFIVRELMEEDPGDRLSAAQVCDYLESTFHNYEYCSDYKSYNH